MTGTDPVLNPPMQLYLLSSLLLLRSYMYRRSTNKTILRDIVFVGKCFLLNDALKHAHNQWLPQSLRGDREYTLFVWYMVLNESSCSWESEKYFTRPLNKQQ